MRLSWASLLSTVSWRFALGLAVLCGGSILNASSAHAANALNAVLSDDQPKKDPASDEMLVEADELINNKDTNTLVARGAAQVYRQGHTVLADTITFYRETKRVVAVGNVKLIEPNGQVIYANDADITQNFQKGFINAMKSDNPVDRTHFAAQRAERQDGNLTEYTKGVYTACEPCKDDPSKPPLWQVKSAKVIHNKTERTVYYHDARLELWGFPVGYFPFFTAPDPTVRRRSGWLHPVYGYKTALGAFISAPYYLNLAPDYDATITPMITSRQGLHMKTEWRQRFETGEYAVRASGIYQLDPEAMRYPGNREWRGAVSTSGLFNINQNWQWGWNGTTLSDRRYLRDYRLGPDTELTSEVFLRGMGEHSYFDARLMKFTGLSGADVDRYFPLVHPVVDYSTVFSLPKLIGGQFSFDTNFTSVTRNGLDYAARTTSTGAYNFIYGMPGNSTRLSTQLGWKQNFIDPLGQVWMPFASLRSDLVRYEVDSNAAYDAVLPYPLRNEPAVTLRGMPAFGMEYRYPFISASDIGTQIIEPIVQAVVRPNERRIGSLPNEDSQSFIFDDSNLFDTNKFSGYDRMEGGTRVNAGVQYSLLMNNGMNIGAMIGESFHVMGRNSYGTQDLLRVGFDSGLQSHTSDYVSRLSFQPNETLKFSARMRFDKETFAMQRGAFDVSGNFGPLTANLGYLNVAPQELLGNYTYDQALFAHLRYKLTDQWSVYGGAYHNLESNKRISEYMGITYQDECTTASVEYKGTRVRNIVDVPTHDIMFRVNLRTLGETKVSQSVGQKAAPPL